MSPRLGDALLSMIVVNNLQCQGFSVTVYSNYLTYLRDWFPDFSLEPYPADAAARVVLSQYDVLLHTYRHDIVGHADQWHPNVVVFNDDPLLKRPVSMV